MSQREERIAEMEERAKLIELMLDVIYPLNPEMPQSVREGVDNDRQMLALRAGWLSMPIEELRRLCSVRR